MIKLGSEKVLRLHQLMIKEIGGSAGLRDFNLLDSALEGIYQTFGGQDLYCGKEEKAAQLCYSLISNHAFVDGNKRIGIFVMLTFLEVNGIPIERSNVELIDLGLGIADGKYKYEYILKWICEHKIFQ